ncbi:MAG: 50S ribosomal protein L19e [Candidatus Helarchaeota archaeon]
MNLKSQRRIAAEILKIGKNRVWIDPERIDDVSMAITRNDIRSYIKDGAIKARYKKGVSRSRAREIQLKKRLGRRRGPGSRKGKKYSVISRKRRHILKIRPIRKHLKKLRARRIITPSVYRQLYRWADGNMFRSIAHVDQFIKDKKLTRR